MDSHGRYRRETFSASLEQLSDGVVAVLVSGEVDQLTVPGLRPVMSEAVEAAARMVLVDMSRVSFLSSAGLAALVEASNHAQESAVRLALVAGNHAVTRAMTVTGLDSMIPMHPSRAAALDAANAEIDSVHPVDH
ncbi:MAG TPA: STAS domain-containing protein [Nakamurella sp.]|jgi:anti-sigma B factor antagonist|nr:STAS domain-containing protein [Nakamurella sp.]